MAEGSIGEPRLAPAVEALEPGGWLAEYQRHHCTGATPLTTYQGLLNDEIMLPQSAASHPDPAQLVLACNAWARALLDQAYFIPGEFAPEAVCGLYAHDYVAQAKAGGHAQYYAMRVGDELALRCAAAGLKSMIADPHLELFNLMLRLRRSPRKTVRKLMAEHRWRNRTAAWNDLDKRLADLEAQEPLMPRQRTWLKSLRKLKIVPDIEMTHHLNRVGNANRLFQHRRQEAARLRAEHERNDPAHKAVRRLCELAGLRFAGLHPGQGNAFSSSLRKTWPEGPARSGLEFRVDTDRGPHAALFYVDGALFKKRRAALIEHGNPVPVGSFTLTRAEFDEIAPAER